MGFFDGLSSKDNHVFAALLFFNLPGTKGYTQNRGGSRRKRQAFIPHSSAVVRIAQKIRLIARLFLIYLFLRFDRNCPDSDDYSIAGVTDDVSPVLPRFPVKA